ncbi:MAG TPA: 16S rRNA (cytidine(1402)-2'-O)-methyltransferase [Patescibacteria group bacterium]|nr:16S rRNA (cytidine(1402)-2'-O)-methyltransferase [Patescibacteria group bacterium]
MGILYIVPTPIGNLQDITLRALEILSNVSFIACEDTRKTGQLLKLLKEKSGLQTKSDLQLQSYYDQIEAQRTPAFINVLKNDFDMALVSDAGTPLISDPGFKLVRACAEAGITVVSLPGASSVNVALTASGLPSDKFFFLGYPPQKPGHRKAFFQKIKESAELISTTFILFEAPHKLHKTLDDMEEILGNIEIVFCRELTKMHEEIWRGNIAAAKERFKKHAPKGEFVLLFHL